MSEHLLPRSSVGSRGSAPHSSNHHHTTPLPRPHGDPDPLASVWIRRLHLTPDPPPPQQPQQPPPVPRDAAAARSAGFGPFRWSPHPLRGGPAGSWDAAPVSGGGGGSPPMLSPFFRFPPPVAEIGEFAPVRPTIGFSSSGGFPGLSSRMIIGGDPHDAWLAARATGSPYPSHDVDMVPMRTSHDLHVRQHSMIPQNVARNAHVLQHSMIPQNVARHAPSSSSMIPQKFARHATSSVSQQDEPFSYWNMGRFQRSTTTESISQITAAPGNFSKKRSADSNSFLPLKFRKLSGSG